MVPVYSLGTWKKAEHHHTVTAGKKSALGQFEVTKAQKWLIGREVSRTVIGHSCLYLCTVLITVHLNFDFGISI